MRSSLAPLLTVLFSSSGLTPESFCGSEVDPRIALRIRKWMEGPEVPTSTALLSLIDRSLLAGLFTPGFELEDCIALWLARFPFPREWAATLPGVTVGNVPPPPQEALYLPDYLGSLLAERGWRTPWQFAKSAGKKQRFVSAVDSWLKPRSPLWIPQEKSFQTYTAEFLEAGLFKQGLEWQQIITLWYAAYRVPLQHLQEGIELFLRWKDLKPFHIQLDNIMQDANWRVRNLAWYLAIDIDSVQRWMTGGMIPRTTILEKLVLGPFKEAFTTREQLLRFWISSAKRPTRIIQERLLELPGPTVDEKVEEQKNE